MIVVIPTAEDRFETVFGYVDLTEGIDKRLYNNGNVNESKTENYGKNKYISVEVLFSLKRNSLSLWHFFYSYFTHFTFTSR